MGNQPNSRRLLGRESAGYATIDKGGPTFLAEALIHHPLTEQPLRAPTILWADGPIIEESDTAIY